MCSVSISTVATNLATYIAYSSASQNSLDIGNVVARVLPAFISGPPPGGSLPTSVAHSPAGLGDLAQYCPTVEDVFSCPTCEVCVPCEEGEVGGPCVNITIVGEYAAGALIATTASLVAYCTGRGAAGSETANVRIRGRRGALQDASPAGAGLARPVRRRA